MGEGEAADDLGGCAVSFRERDIALGTAAVNPCRGIAEDEVDRFSDGSSLGLAGVSSADPELLNVPDLDDPICTGGTAAPADEDEDEAARSEGGAEDSSSSWASMICFESTMRSGERKPHVLAQLSKPDESRFWRRRVEMSFQTSVHWVLVRTLSLEEATNLAQSS